MRRSRPRSAFTAALTLLLTIATTAGAQIAPSAGMLIPPVRRASFNVSVMVVSDVGPGESFRFVMNATAAIVTAKGVAVGFTGGATLGAPYAVSQTDGPRSCMASANRSGVISRDVVVSMDCGRPPGNSQVAGQLHAPVGARVVLQLNGASDLVLTVPPFAGASDAYNLLPFAFVPSIADGTAYTVSVKTAPAGQTCSVYKGATGTLPIPLGALRVGCEFRADMVSRDATGAVRGTYYESGAPVLGGSAGPVGRTSDGYGEGRFIAFMSSAAKLGGSKGAHRQIFWRDRLTGETLLISATGAGVEGNGDSFAPSISADGLNVAFESHATNLVPNDGNGVRDVFLWQANNRQLGVQRISVGAGGVEANAESWEPSISGDGQVVAFTSGASNITNGVIGVNTANVFRRELASGQATLVTRGRKGQGVGGSRPSISEDGMRIAFHSASGDLLAGDANGLWDIFVYDHATSGLRRVSMTTSGGERDQGSESASRVVSPTISGDGKFVVFATTANNMAPVPSGGFQNVFRADVETGAVKPLSLGVGGVAADGDSPVNQGERIAISRDGNTVAFTTGASNLGAPKGGVVMRQVATNLTVQLNGVSPTNLSVGAPALSPAGGFVVFGTNQSLDPRYPGSGVFALLTGFSRSWWWFE